MVWITYCLWVAPAAEREALDVDALAAAREDGAFAACFPGYEHRPQQVAMLRRVAQTFNVGGCLLVEAPTGVGTSLAYLSPAVHWAVQNGERVVISTNTINLQEQLLRKDLPELAAALPFSCRRVGPVTTMLAAGGCRQRLLLDGPCVKSAGLTVADGRRRRR
jgi:DNA polymerase-3 subunit epsilon/ATP-dependent DNA helicase DinG